LLQSQEAIGAKTRFEQNLNFNSASNMVTGMNRCFEN